jgi:mevalonate kinase
MTAKEWEQYGPDILEKFILTESGNFRNERLYKEWLKARQIHEHRRAAAQRTNEMKAQQAQTDAVSDAVTGTVSDLVPDTHKSGKPVHTPAAIGDEMEAATRLFEKIGVPADYATRELAAQAIRYLSLADSTGAGIGNATLKLQGLAEADQAAGETINRFYFSDQKYLHKSNGKKVALDAEARVGRWDGLSDIDRAKKKRAEGKPLTEIERELLQEELTQ